MSAFREWKGLKSICVVQRMSTKLTTGETTVAPAVFHKQSASGASGDSALYP